MPRPLVARGVPVLPAGHAREHGRGHRRPDVRVILDLVDALRTNDDARSQVEQLLVYLLGSTAGGNARAATMAASVDVLQSLNDDPDLQPLYAAAADVLGAQKSVATPQGQTTTRGLADGAIELLAHLFAKARNPAGQEICAEEIDPNGAIASILTTFVAPPAGAATASASAPDLPNLGRGAEFYFSPDGTHIIGNAQREGDTGFRVYTLKIDGTDIRRIEDEGDDACSFYFPDGKRIIWTSTKDRPDWRN